MDAQIKGIDKLPFLPPMEVDFIYEKDGRRALRDLEKEMNKDIKSILRGFDAAKEPFSLVKRYLDRRLRDSFDREKSMEGEKWQSLKQSSIERKERGGFGNRGILQQTRRMRGSVWRGTLKGGRAGFLKGRRHALLYDPSSKLGRKGRKMRSLHVHQKGSVKNRTPARPFIGLASKDERKINELFRNWAIANLRKT